MTLRAETDDELLAAAPKDPEAFARFYRRHAPAVLSYLARVTRDPELALDLTSEVFASALLAARRWRPARRPARAWLLVIARNKFYDHQRRRVAERTARGRLTARELFDDEAFERVEQLVDLERSSYFELLLGDLPDEERVAVAARIIHERDYPEIARFIGCSEAAIRKRVSRGLARLAIRRREGELS
jgi:RNA polymerase sigma factor (sigma-70 family)